MHYILLVPYDHNYWRYIFPGDFPKQRGSPIHHELNVIHEHIDAIDKRNHYDLNQANDNDSYGRGVPVK